MPAPLPVTVMTWAPIAAPLPTLIVIVEVPEPGAAMEVGLNVTLCAPPCPVADKVIAESKLPSAAVVMVTVPVAPWASVIAVGDALILKSALDDEVTVRLIVVVWVTPPPTPETVIV